MSEEKSYLNGALVIDCANKDAEIARLTNILREQQEILSGLDPITCSNGIQHKLINGCLYCDIARLKEELENAYNACASREEDRRTTAKENAALTERVKRLEFSLSDEISLSSAVIKERYALLERVKELEELKEEYDRQMSMMDVAKVKLEEYHARKLTESQGRIERAIDVLDEYEVHRHEVSRRNRHYCKVQANPER